MSVGAAQWKITKKSWAVLERGKKVTPLEHVWESNTILLFPRGYSRIESQRIQCSIHSPFCSIQLIKYPSALPSASSLYQTKNNNDAAIHSSRGIWCLGSKCLRTNQQ